MRRALSVIVPLVLLAPFVAFGAESVPLVFDDDGGSGRDAGWIRETAVRLEPGHHSGQVSPGTDSFDAYVLFIEAGERLHVELDDVNMPVVLRLYDPEDRLFNWDGYHLDHVITRTGDWLLVFEFAGVGVDLPYAFTVEIDPPVSGGVLDSHASWQTMEVVVSQPGFVLIEAGIGLPTQATDAWSTVMADAYAVDHENYRLERWAVDHASASRGFDRVVRAGDVEAELPPGLVRSQSAGGTFTQYYLDLPESLLPFHVRFMVFRAGFTDDAAPVNMGVWSTVPVAVGFAEGEELVTWQAPPGPVNAPGVSLRSQAEHTFDTGGRFLGLFLPGGKGGEITLGESTFAIDGNEGFVILRGSPVSVDLLRHEAYVVGREATVHFAGARFPSLGLVCIDVSDPCNAPDG